MFFCDIFDFGSRFDVENHKVFSHNADCAEQDLSQKLVLSD